MYFLLTILKNPPSDVFLSMALGKLESLTTLGFQYFLQLLLKKVELRIDESSSEMKNAARSMLGLFLATSKQRGEDIFLRIEVLLNSDVSEFISDFRIYKSCTCNSCNASNQVRLMSSTLNCHHQIKSKIYLLEFNLIKT